MPGQKSPVLLRVMIVGVALFLGFSLNMFQFRNPFRSTSSDYEQGKQALNPVKPEPPVTTHPPQTESIHQESPVPLPLDKPSGKPGEAGKQAGQVAKGKDASAGASQASGAGSPASVQDKQEAQRPDDAAKAQPAMKAEPAGQQAAEAKPGTADMKPGVPEAVPQPPVAASSGPSAESRPAPEVAAKSPESNPAPPGTAGSPEPATVAVAPDQPALTAPKVATGSDAVKAAKLGRMTPAGKAEQGAAVADAAASKTREPAAAPLQPGESAVGDKPKAAPAPQAKADGDAAPATDTPANASAPGTPGVAEPATPEEKAQAQAGGNVLEIKAEEKPGEFVLTIVTAGPVGKVTTFHAKNPARLAVDLWGGWQAAGPMNRPVNGEMIERVRLGLHPDKMRLVIDYKDKELKSLSEPIVEKQAKGIVVRLPKVKAGE